MKGTVFILLICSLMSLSTLRLNIPKTNNKVITEHVHVLPKIPTTEELIESTPLYKKSVRVEKILDETYTIVKNREYETLTARYNETNERFATDTSRKVFKKEHNNNDNLPDYNINWDIHSGVGFSFR